MWQAIMENAQNHTSEMTNNDIVTDLLQSDLIMYVAEFITALCS